MKLASYRLFEHDGSRIGALCQSSEGAALIDLRRAYASFLSQGGREPRAEVVARARIPASLLELLQAGPAGLEAARQALLHVQARLADGIPATLFAAQGLLHRMSDVELLAPIPRPGKIVSVGANYQEHVQEGRDSGVLGRLPSYPPAFLKMPSAVVGPEAAIVFPSYGEELDYEVELAIVIGQYCQDVEPSRWREVVAGYTIINDLGLRDTILREKDTGIIVLGKNFPGACPMGPFLVTADELPDPDDLPLRLKVNGEVRQQDRTSSMVHDCGTVVSYWSRLGLEPGDVLTTGTPGGSAGFGRRHPDRLLRPGDVIEAEIEGIGCLRNTITAGRPAID